CFLDFEGEERAHRVVLGTSVGLIGAYAETNPLQKMSNPARRSPTVTHATIYQ
ncbi:unnamed protein product, partial [Adineta ricciae]